MCPLLFRICTYTTYVRTYMCPLLVRICSPLAMRPLLFCICVCPLRICTYIHTHMIIYIYVHTYITYTYICVMYTYKREVGTYPSCYLYLLISLYVYVLLSLYICSHSPTAALLDFPDRRASAHITTLQHTATHCNSLQLTATHCNTLQLFTKKSGSSSCWTSPTAGTILICIYTHIRTYISLFGIPASTDGCGNIKQMCGDVSADVGISNRGIHVCMCVYIHMCIVVRPRSTDIHTHRISNRDIYMCFVYSCIYTDMIHRHECVIAHV